MAFGTYIAEVRISTAVRAKINTKHNVSEQDVREAFVATRLLSSGWSYSETTGSLRLLVVGRTYSGRTLKGTLYPVPGGDGIWWLGTAFWSTR
ncbi:MAG: hypothetical protein ABSF89_16340 [Acidimicrobiales bacterium]|jgi:hypothetical protein